MKIINDKNYLNPSHVFSNEVWAKIDFWENYSISNYGRVYSFKNKIIRKPKIHHTGYAEVNLTNGSIRKHYNIHRLVANTFLKMPKNITGLIVRHKDFDKLNNHFSNLEWCTDFENKRRGGNERLFLIEDNHPMAKITNNTASEIKGLLLSGMSQMDISRRLKVSFWIVSDIKRGKSWVNVLPLLPVKSFKDSSK